MWQNSFKICSTFTNKSVSYVNPFKIIIIGSLLNFFRIHGWKHNVVDIKLRVYLLRNNNEKNNSYDDPFIITFFITFVVMAFGVKS